MTEAIAEQMFNANVRIERMFWIPGLCAGTPSDFDEFVEDELADEAAVLEALPFLEGPLKESWSGEDIPSEIGFRGKNGFIFQAATPRPSNIRKDGSYSFSWGSYFTKWMYADTLEEIATKSAEWARAMVEAERAKAA